MKYFYTSIGFFLLFASTACGGPSDKGEVALKNGDYRVAIKHFDEALASDIKTYGDQHPQVATDWNNLGMAWHSLGEYQKAIEYYNKTLARAIKTYGEQHPDVAVQWFNLGMAWRSRGEYKKAIDYYERALKIIKDQLDPDYPFTKLVKHNLEQARAMAKSASLSD